jgi:hypothetical protein
VALVRTLLCCALGLALAAGCGGAADPQLTPEQIEKQRAEDKVDLDAEDKAEKEYQRKLRQQGS